MIAIKIIDGDEITASKFFGRAFLPESWLGSDEFSESEIFFCQIALADLKGFEGAEVLPDEGYLYFFMDFDRRTVKGTVRFALSPDAYTFFNEQAEIDYDVETERLIGFYRADDADAGLLPRHKKLSDSEVCLLKFTPDRFDKMDFLSGVNGSIMFVIDAKDLKNRRFDKAFLINVTD